MARGGWLSVFCVVAGTAACGDGGPASGDDGTSGDVEEAGDETGVPDGDAGDGGAGVPCTMDFDCAPDEACRDGVCTNTSPDGWCPRIFERPVRRVPAEELGGWWPDGSVTTASCGPRCVVVCHHPDGGDPTVLIRRRTADGTISQATATLPFAEEAAPPFRCLAAIEEPDGAVIVIGGTTVYSTIPIAILGYRVVGDAAEETTRLLTTDLEIDNQVNAMRLQRDDVGRLHAFGDETHDACYLHLVADGGRFHREAGLCVGTGDYLTRTSDAALRPDGAGIDLVMAAGWRPAFGDDGMFWMDGTAPVAADAVRLPDGSLGQPLYPYVCVGPGGSVVASAVYVPPAPPFPETPGPADGTLRLWSLAPGGLVSSTADHPVPEGMVYEGRLDAMYRVLYCTSDEVVVDYRGMDGRWRIDVWAGGTVTERDLQTVASDSGEVRALMNFDTTPRDTWYQPCAGVRAIVPARNTTTVDHGAIYLEW